MALSKIIAVINEKGGVGKTTVTLNLAHGLSLRGLKVHLVDTDPQDSLLNWHEINELNHGTNMPCVSITKTTLPLDIKSIVAAHDVTIIDGAPGLQSITGTIVRVADIILIPIKASHLDFWAMLELVETIKCKQEVTGGSPKAAFLMSMDRKNTVSSREIYVELEKLGLPVLTAKTHNYVAYTSCIPKGETVFQQKGAAAQEFEEIVSEVMTKFLDINILPYDNIKI